MRKGERARIDELGMQVWKQLCGWVGGQMRKEIVWTQDAGIAFMIITPRATPICYY